MLVKKGSTTQGVWQSLLSQMNRKESSLFLHLYSATLLYYYHHNICFPNNTKHSCHLVHYISIYYCCVIFLSVIVYSQLSKEAYHFNNTFTWNLFRVIILFNIGCGQFLHCSNNKWPFVSGYALVPCSEFWFASCM